MRYGLQLEKAQRWILPYAAAAAITDCAVDAKAHLVKEFPIIFDRPTPFTLNGMVTVPATKTSMTAELRVKDIQAKYLLLEDTGGTRTPQMSAGGKGNALLAPGKGLQLDAYGNIPAGYARRVIAAAINRNEKIARLKKGLGREGLNSSSGYFLLNRIGPGGRGPGGVFMRLAGGTYLRVLSFVSSEKYSARMEYRSRVYKVVRENFRVYMGLRIEQQAARRGWGKG
jgi:hypothetical protein